MQRFFIFLLSALTLSGCSSVVTSPVEVQEGASSTAVVIPNADNNVDVIDKSTSAQATARTTQNPAVLALLDESEQQLAANTQRAAVASIERALRIDNKNPELWHRLAVIRAQEQRWSQSLNLAQRSNALAAQRLDLQHANWQLILQAGKKLGDRATIKQAEAALKSLSSR